MLQPEGVALFVESRRDADCIRRSELRSLVEPHGFALDEVRGRSFEYTARFRVVARDAHPHQYPQNK